MVPPMIVHLFGALVGHRDWTSWLVGRWLIFRQPGEIPQPPSSQRKGRREFSAWYVGIPSLFLNGCKAILLRNKSRNFLRGQVEEWLRYEQVLKWKMHRLWPVFSWRISEILCLNVPMADSGEMEKHGGQRSTLHCYNRHYFMLLNLSMANANTRFFWASIIRSPKYREYLFILRDASDAHEVNMGLSVDSPRIFRPLFKGMAIWVISWESIMAMKEAIYCWFIFSHEKIIKHPRKIGDHFFTTWVTGSWWTIWISSPSTGGLVIAGDHPASSPGNRWLISPNFFALVAGYIRLHP